MSSHSSAKASHYDEDAAEYDLLNEERSREMNRLIEQILKQHSVKIVLDMTCGTGSQVFWLADRGYDVTGSDISEAMLNVARRKNQKERRNLPFLHGDMRSLNVGQYDGVLTIFNAIGHLTQEDFEKAIQNIHSNLKEGGLYLFDIFNLDYLLHEDTITSLTIDWLKKEGDRCARKIQYSTINEEGILASYTISVVQNGKEEPKTTTSQQTLQVYTAEKLQTLLQRNGFEVIDQISADGSPFRKAKSERILTLARKAHE